MRALIVIALLTIAAAAYAQVGPSGGLNYLGTNAPLGPQNLGTLAPPPSDCVTATNGQVDLSFCSNAIYLALII